MITNYIMTEDYFHVNGIIVSESMAIMFVTLASQNDGISQWFHFSIHRLGTIKPSNKGHFFLYKMSKFLVENFP